MAHSTGLPEPNTVDALIVPLLHASGWREDQMRAKLDWVQPRLYDDSSQGEVA